MRANVKNLLVVSEIKSEHGKKNATEKISQSHKM